MAIAIGKIKEPLIQNKGSLTDWMNREKVADTGGMSGNITNYRQSTYGDNPQNDYRGIFESATRDLGQGPNANPEFLKKVTNDTLDAFIENHLKVTGQLPTDEMVGDFASKTITPTFAMNAIKNGGINRDAITSQYVKPYFQENSIAGQADTSGVDDLAAEYDKTYGSLGDYLQQQNKQATDDQLNQFMESEAAFGRLRDPASIVGANKIRASGQNANAISQAGLASTRGQGLAGLSQAIAQIGESGRQANQNLGLKREELRNSVSKNLEDQNLQRQSIGVAERVGRLQAQAKEPTWMDYTKLGIEGVNAAANAKKAFG